jgi:hypothetical protein
MRYWPLVERSESFPTPFEHEFVNLRIHAVRRRTLNFELSAEPRLTELDSTDLRPNDEGL